MRIAFFDSGIGGISVLHQARQFMPDEDYLYYADTDHVPYGNKTPEQILSYVEEATAFIAKQDVKALVVACNTATSIAIQQLRAEYDFPIVGMEPAVKPAIQISSPEQRVLVTATPVTIREKKLHNLLKRLDVHHQVDLLPLPGLVELAEKEAFDGTEAEEYLREAMAPFPLEQYSGVVLGCTHFRYFADSFQKILPEQVQLVDGNFGTAQNLHHILQERNLLEHNTGDVIYYTSGRPAQEMVPKYERLLHRLDMLW